MVSLPSAQKFRVSLNGVSRPSYIRLGVAGIFVLSSLWLVMDVDPIDAQESGGGVGIKGAFDVHMKVAPNTVSLQIPGGCGSSGGNGDLVVLGTREIDMPYWNEELLTARDARDAAHKFQIVSVVHNADDVKWQSAIPE
ncbi:hypothetical protein M413DRAFT_29828 [Hebeloma cylindrosporum]|uniref:Uncharacterized protein n=1 Tax=Hebeloma cylindrosporum TaxID=76867 RepID=A0A0C3C3P2_HEBCY|nr:hypothetical protein M413DRAFT_29828 [Hebeloma cylindrosporum h7]